MNKQESYDDLPDTPDIDPSLLECFGSYDAVDADASLENSFWALDKVDCGDSLIEGYTVVNSNRSDLLKNHPCMSGFLSEQADTLVFCFPLQRWTERWCVATEHPSGAELLSFRKDAYAAPSRRILVDAAARRETARDAALRCAFSVGERGAARRPLLAAQSDAQARAWVACVNAILQRRLLPPPPPPTSSSAAPLPPQGRQAPPKAPRPRSPLDS